MLKRTLLDVSGTHRAGNRRRQVHRVTGSRSFARVCREIDQREDGRGRETLGASLVAGHSDHADVSVGFSDRQETENHRENCFADADTLYVGYEAEDTDITATYENRDDPTYKDDCVEIFIKPSQETDSYFGMEMNARGVLYDYFYPFPKGLDKDLNFDGVQLKTTLAGNAEPAEAIRTAAGRWKWPFHSRTSLRCRNSSHPRAERNGVCRSIGGTAPRIPAAGG